MKQKKSPSKLRGRAKPGGVCRAVGVAANVARRKKNGAVLAEEALRLSEEKYRALAEAAQDMIFIISRDDTVEYVNSYAAKSLGMEPQDVIGQPRARLFPPDVAERQGRNLRRVFRTGEPASTESEMPSRKGRLWIHTVLAPIRNGSGRVRAVLGISRDITTRKEAEEQFRNVLRHSRTITMHATVTAPDGWDQHEPEWSAGRYCWNIKVNDEATAWEVFPMKRKKGECFVRTWMKNRAPDDRRPMDMVAARAFASGTASYDSEFRCRDEHGAWRHILEAAAVQPAGHGCWRVTLFDTDITARKQAEEALRESEARLAGAQEIAHLGSWELDLTRNDLVWSDEVYRIFGLQPREFGATYEAFLDRVHLDDRAAVDAAYSGSLREGRDSYEIEHRIVRNVTGEVRWVQEKCRHVRDATGKIVRSLGMVLDITERKQAGEALLASEERLRQGVRVAGLGLFEHDHREETIYWSPLMRKIHGLGKDAFISLEEIVRLVIPEDRPAFATSVLRAHDPTGDDLFCTEHRIVRPDGDIRWVSTRSLTTFEGEGEARRPLRTVGATRDITVRKQAEMALRRMHDELEERVIERTAELARANERLKAEMAGREHLQHQIHAAGEMERQRIGHDLHDGVCQILAAIRFKSELLARGLARSRRGDAGEAQAIADLLKEAVGQTRNIVRGLQPVEPLPEGLEAALEQLAEQTGDMFGIDCRFIHGCDGLVLDHGVATNLFRIAQEAVTNAVKHGKARAVRIRLDTRGGRLVLSVASDGRRMPRRIPSTGMGVKIMRHRAECIAARLEIGPGPEGGALVTCTLPLTENKSRGAAPPASR